METRLTPLRPMIGALREVVGSDAVIMDDAEPAWMASDLYAEGPRPVMVVRPDTRTAVAVAIATAATSAIRWCDVMVA